MSQEYVLIVEDSPYVAGTVAEVVRCMGYETRIAAQGEEALRLISEDPPLLVILDWMLPGVQGIDVLAQIRRSLTPDLPVVMLTARGELEAVLRGLETGADDYVAKPFNVKELQARIASVLRRHQEDNPS